MGFTEILTVVFVILKLTGAIAWSWWLVLLPELIALPIYICYVVAYAVAFRRIRKIARQVENEFIRRS